MNCIHLTVALLSLSVCHPEAPPQRLRGVWVGTLEVGGDLKFIRAEFHSGVKGTLHLEGGGDLTLVHASESSVRASQFASRKQPCDSALPTRSGEGVPWMP